MDRKTFLERATLLGGCTLVAPSVLMQSCNIEPRIWSTLSEADSALLDDLGETILPKSATLPGAKSVEIGKYVVQIVNDCLSAEDQDTFLTGLGSIESLSIQHHDKPFEKLSAETKTSVITDLQNEAILFNQEQEGVDEPKVHYFSLLKELVIAGYFSSKTVLTDGFNYSPIPGTYQGCVDFDMAKDKIYKG